MSVASKMRMPMRRVQIFIPVLIGIISFVIVTGGTILNPSNIAWMAWGDPRQHYLGWAFFRQDEWRWPLGLNPNFGLELGSAVAFSDSLPLFAIPFKLLEPILPSVFQYFGIWILVCFILQAIFAWRICGLISYDLVARVEMCGFFAFAPPMLWRLHGHSSLIGHFLILSAIYLSLISREHRHSVAFAVMVSASAAVHAYLLAMVAAIWLASLADGLWNRRISIRAGIIEFCAVLAIVALICWQVGFFSVGQGVASGGYGIYRMNLLALVNADGWSRILPGIRDGEGDYEGFNYLGIGLLLLAILSIPFAIKSSSLIPKLFYRAPFSCLLIVALIVFALSNVVGFSIWSVSYPLMGVIEKFSHTFRSSGRMFWPVYYVIVTLILVATVRGLGIARARWVLALALVLQVVDTSAGWTFRHIQLTVPSSDRWPTPMQNAFWQQAAGRYSKVRWIMPENQSPHWAELSDYAVRHGMATDAAFLARIGTLELIRTQVDAEERLKSGQFDNDTLYVIDAKSIMQAVDTASGDDLVATIDGLYVLAPGWRRCEDCGRDYEFNPNSLYGPLLPGRDVVFATDEARPYRLDGWGDPEAWGVWSVDNMAVLGFSSPLPKRFRMTLEAHAFRPNATQAFSFSAGGSPVLVRIGQEQNDVSFEMSAAPDMYKIYISVPQATSPSDLGLNTDPRRLGLGLIRFRIDPLE